MRPYAELSGGGRTRRLSTLVRRHLRQHHGLDVARVRPPPATFNRFFAVAAQDGRRVAVRVSDIHRIHRPGVEDIEHRWLDQLATQPSISAPQLLIDRHGASCHTRHEPELGGPHTVTVFTWVPGRRLRRPVGPNQARRAGEALARLHAHALDTTATDDAELGLDANGPITFEPTDAIDRWAEGPTSLLRDGRARAQEAIDALWANPPHRPHLLHGDFGPHNLLADGDTLRVVDFQDVQRGFAVQDVAVTWADMIRWGSPTEARRALADGYRLVRPWPADDPEQTAALVAARTLNLVNLGLVVQRPGFDDWVGRHIADLRRWMSR